MGAAHVAAISAYPAAKLVAVAGREEKTRNGDFSDVGGNQSLGKRVFDFSDVRKYSDWRGVIDDKDVEAVSICLPSNYHCEATLAALSAGKHVLCEKPMALTSSDCDRMLAAAADEKRILMVGHVLRFWPEYLALRKFVEKGGVRYAMFNRRCALPAWSPWLHDDLHSGGAVLDLLIHDIDQILSLFGMPERVTAKRIGEHDALMASFLYPGGPEVRLQGGWFESGVPFSMSFQVRSATGEMELTPDGLMLSDSTGVRSRVDVEQQDGYQTEVHYFLDCCRSNTQPLFCPPNESAKAVKVALALKQSRAFDGEQISCN